MHAERRTTRPGKLLALLAVPLLLAMGAALFVVLGADDATLAPDADASSTTVADSASDDPATDEPGPSRRKPSASGGADASVAAILRGRIREYGTRAAVVGMELRLTAASDVKGQPGLELTTTTDPDGTFRFTALPPRGGYELSGLREPFAAVALPGIELLPSETRDIGTIWLDVPVDLHVRVMDLSGTPVGGAEVAVFATAGGAVAVPEPDSEQASGGVASAGITSTPRPTATAETGSDGRAVVAGLLPGTYHVRATATGHGAAARSGVVLAPDAAPSPLRLLLPAAYALAGTVFDAEGAPVADARVIAAPQMSRMQAADKVEATTDAAGAYRLEGLVAGVHAVFLARPERALLSAGRVRIPEMDRWDIRLRPTAVIVGTVTDEAGAGIAGATVEYAPQGGLPVVATSAEDGTYRLEDVVAGPSQWFRVRADGYLAYPDATNSQEGSGESLREGAEVRRDVTLRAGSRVVITVKAADDGAPVEAARITLHAAQMWGGAGKPPVATTDETGVAAFPGVELGSYLVRIDVHGFVQEGLPVNWSALLQSPQAIPPDWLLEVTEDTTHEFAVSRGGRVEGVVLGRDGTPFGGALVRVTGASPLVPVYSGEDGAFVVDAVPERHRAVATASAPGSPGSTSEPFQVAAGETVKGIEIRLGAGAVVTGRARSADGAPLEGAFARIVPGVMNERNPWGFQAFERAEVHPVTADGSFTIPDVANGQYTVRVDAAGHLPGWDATVNVEENRDVGGVDLILDVAAEISGRVQDPTGQPVPGADVSGNYTGTAQDRRWGFVSSIPGNPTAQTDANGRFVLRGLKAGNYSLWASAPDFAAGSANDVASGTQEVVLTLTESETISGVVKAPDGTPLAGVPVQAQSADNTRGRGWRGGWSSGWGGGGNQVFTAPDGTFEILGLSEGVYNLTVSASSMWGRDVNVRDTTLQGVRTGRDDVEILVEAGSEIAGKVVDADDRPVTVGWIAAVAETNNSGGNRWGGNQRWARLGNDGSFRISGLAPGTYTITVSGSFLADPVQGVSAGTTSVEVRTRTSRTISGRLVESSGLSIATGFNVQVRKQGTENWGWAQTLQPGDGAFTIIGLEEGAYDVQIQASPYAPVVESNVLAGRQDLAIVLQQGREIAGTVLDASGNPIAANVQALQTDAPAGATPSNGWSRAGADGQFRLIGLPDGAYRLMVRAGNHAPATIANVRAGASGLRISLEVGVTVSGKIHYESGDPAAGARLQLLSEGQSVAWSRSDAEGAFTFTNVPTGGEWTIQGQVWANGERIQVAHPDPVASGAENVEVTVR